MIQKANQVWTSDMTYIKLNNRWFYFIVIMDLFSRYIITSGLSHSLAAPFYIQLLQKALHQDIPEMFNTDQGSQFTCPDWIKILTEHQIQISMDHQGRCYDNIWVERFWRTLKQEAVYSYKPEHLGHLERILDDFIDWYNHTPPASGFRLSCACLCLSGVDSRD